MYTVEGGRHLPERELDHLPGYAGSKPVRIGNGAVDQRQTDVLGEVMCALSMARHHGLDETRDSWSLQRTLVNELARELAAAGPRPVGDPRPAAPLHAQPGDGLGGVRPGDRGRRGARPRRSGRRLATASATRCAPRSWSAGTTPSGTPSPSTTTTERGRRLAAGAAARAVHRRRRPEDEGHHRGGRAGPDARRPADALPHLDRGRRSRGRRAPVPGLLVLARLGVRPRRADGRGHAR